MMLFFYCTCDHQYLLVLTHPFPSRRSSALGVEFFLRLVGDTQRADRPDHHAIAHLLELARREDRRAPKLGHVGKQRNARKCAGKLAEHFGGRKSTSLNSSH